MATQKVPINGKILCWAREEAQLSLDVAAAKAGITGIKTKDATQRLKEWETGKDQPTINQLAKLAKLYCRPPLTFYLKKHPQPTAGVTDFRMIGDRGVPEASTRLRALVARVKARQEEVIDLLLDEDESFQKLPFIGKFRSDADPKTVSLHMQKIIALPRCKINDSGVRFRKLRTRIEDLGIFVMLEGDLGSSHTDIEPEEFRGFVLANPYAPFIVLNDNDAKAARLFSLIHELAHLWINESGISNVNPFANTTDQNKIEKFCNKVAAEFLMPEKEFLSDWTHYVNDKLERAVENLANSYGVSRAAVAFRLREFGKISEDDWWRLFRMYQDNWRQLRQRQRDSNTHPPYSIVKKSRLGSKLIRTVLSALDAGELSHTRASRILGTTAKNFERLRAGGHP